mgnify:CR=1 FL=1
MGSKKQESDQFLTSEIIIISGWHFNQSSHNLQKDEKTVRLEPKTAQLLSYMAQNQRKPLSREQLLQSVWTDVIVSDYHGFLLIAETIKIWSMTFCRHQRIPKSGS